MKTPAVLRASCVVLCSLLFTSWIRAGNLLDVLFPADDLQTITVTDMTPEGNLRRQPSPDHPVYYAAVSAGYRDLGGMKAGEKPIDRHLLNKTLMKILAKQGYLPAATDQRPDIVLVWSWGTLNLEKFIGPSGMTIRLNEGQLVQFLGGEKLGLMSKYHDPFPEQTLMPGLINCSVDAQNLRDTATGDLYVAVVAAYDVNLRDSRHAVLLWNTRISCPARGFWLPEALPAMIAIAGPYIGRETPKPVWIRATEKFKPDIRLGDTKLMEYIDSGKPPLVEFGPSR